MSAKTVLLAIVLPIVLLAAVAVALIAYCIYKGNMRTRAKNEQLRNCTECAQ
ncbi:hypothetical protein AAVH_36383, partial [Aphelenchoides avenae]